MFSSFFLYKYPKASSYSSIDWTTPPNTSSHSIHLNITNDHDPNPNKDNKDEYMRKDDDQYTNPAPTTSPVPPLEDNQDFDNSDDTDD